jgi:bifunctional non-homologous end joining protein LigD
MFFPHPSPVRQSLAVLLAPFYLAQQEFVIGGYTVGGRTFDALVFGYYDGSRLLYAARTRNGFTPPLRESLMRRFRGMETPICPFANLPEARSGRWGQGLTAAKMGECRWLKPELVGQFEFRDGRPTIICAIRASSRSGTTNKRAR